MLTLQKHAIRKGLLLEFYIFAALSFLMISQLKDLANYIATLLYIFLCILSFSKLSGIKRTTLMVCFFCIFYIISSIPNGDFFYCVKYTFYYLLIFSPVLFFNIYIDDKNLKKDEIQFGLLIFVSIWIVVSLISLRLYFQDSTIARSLTNDSSNFSETIIGGYELAYGSVLLSVYLMGELLNTKLLKPLKLLYIVLLCIMILLVFMTQSTLTSFSLILGIFTSFIMFVKNSRRKSIIVFSLAFIAISFVLISLYYDSIVYLLSSSFSTKDESLFSRRIAEVIGSVFYNDQTRHYNLRTSVVEQSINLFFESPFIGHGYKYGNIFYAGKVYGIGNHSEFFDSLARFGIIGSIPIFYIYCSGLRNIKHHRLSLIVSFFVLIMFNPFISFAPNLALFVIIPFFERLNHDCDIPFVPLEQSPKQSGLFV